MVLTDHLSAAEADMNLVLQLVVVVGLDEGHLWLLEVIE